MNPPRKYMYSLASGFSKMNFSSFLNIAAPFNEPPKVYNGPRGASDAAAPQATGHPAFFGTKSHETRRMAVTRSPTFLMPIQKKQRYR